MTPTILLISISLGIPTTIIVLARMAGALRGEA